MEPKKESETATTCTSALSLMPKGWNNRDYILITLAVFIKFSVGTVVFLPGVITSKVSCELEYSGFFEQGVLALILHASLCVSNLAAVPLARKVGERATLLCSLYFSVIVIVFSSLVPGYKTLIISRALTGLACGLNITTVGVFGAKRVSSTAILPRFSFIHDSIAHTLGTSWTAAAGWLLLDRVGWRAFILGISLPLFIPPLIILHYYIEEESTSSESTSLTQNKNEIKSVENFTMRVLKASLFGGLNLFIGYGSVHLLPALHGKIDIDSKILMKNGQCEDGDQSGLGRKHLIYTGVIGTANMLGRPLGYFLRSQVKFRILQTTLMCGFALCYVTILTKPGALVESIMMTIGKLCYSTQGPERSILHYDVEFFGRPDLSLGAALMQAACSVGGILITCLIIFIDAYQAIILILLASLAQIIVIFSFKER